MGSPFMASSGLRYPGPHPEQLAEKYQRSKVVKSRFQAAAHEEDLTATQHRDFSLSHEQTPLTCLGSKVVWMFYFTHCSSVYGVLSAMVTAGDARSCC